MHLSTSSSNDRVVPFRYFRVWILLIVTVVMAFSMLEWLLRVNGARICISETFSSWSMMYEDGLAKVSGRKNIVFLGVSRVEFGISPATINEIYPGYNAVNLGVGGRGIVPVLAELASDENFDGIVVCSVSPEYLNPNINRGMQPWVDHLKAYRINYNMRINQRIQYEMQSRFVYFSRYNTPLNNAVRFLKIFFRKGLLPGYYTISMPDGQAVFIDGSVTDSEREKLKLKRLNKDVELYKERQYGSFSEFQSVIDHDIIPHVKKIQERGGIVILLRMPESGEYWQTSQQWYPEWKCWEYIRESVPAVCIHFTDYESLSGFECWDGSHLGYSDSLVFSQNLMKIIDREINTDFYDAAGS